MQPTFTEIKKAGRIALKNRWPEAILVSMILVGVLVLDTVMQFVLMSILRVDAVWTPIVTETVTLLEVAVSCGITLFSAIFSLLVILPLVFGVLRWFWLITSCKDADIIEIFHFFSNTKLFFKTLKIAFSVIWRIIVAAVVCFLPSVVCNQLLRPEIYNYFGFAMPIWLSGLFPLVSLLIIWGFASFILWIARYALIYTVIFNEPELSAKQTIKKSILLSHGRRLRLVAFVFSFAGWVALSLLVLPILFVVPFIFAALCVYGREEYRFANSTDVENV